METPCSADGEGRPDVFAKVGTVAKRLLLERGVATVDDLHPDLSLAVLKSAWWEVLSDGAVDPQCESFRRSTEAWVEFLVNAPPAADRM